MTVAHDRQRVTMALVHAVRHRDDAAVQAIADAALTDHDPLLLLVTDAALMGGLAVIVEYAIDRLLARTDLLALAAERAAAGHPLRAADFALDARAVLASAGQSVALLD